MSDNTKIEWTDATWNPVRGCTRVSEGCRNCYAERVAARFSGPGMPYDGLARMTPSGPRWTGKVRVVEKVLDQPARWKRPRRIFVNSMSDLFHEALAFDDILRIFESMVRAPQHTFQVLTKRPGRVLEFVYRQGSGFVWPRHVWLGVSVEDQAAAVARIPYLVATPAPVKFLSCEPLLGPLDLRNIELVPASPPHGPGVVLDSLTGVVQGPDDVLSRLNWVIVGGESGPGARPLDPAWVTSLRDQCAATSTAFFFKQWGGKEKKLAGRVLGGRTWSEFPAVQP